MDSKRIPTINMSDKLKIYAVLICVVLFSACYFDKKEQIYPQAAVATCDTTNTTYTATIAPIISANCASCHSTALANMNGGGIILDSYASIKPYVTNNFLLNSIVQNGSVKPMPMNSPKMDACSIKKISVWINKGALNN